MKIGQMFTVKDETYGFTGLSKTQCVQAYRFKTGKIVQFRQDYSRAHLIPSLLQETSPQISQQVIGVMKEQQEHQQEALGLMYQLREGDKFVGTDGKIYTFIRIKQTRFECTRDGQSYNAKPGFIKGRA
jgi:hypothetical protein